MGLRHLVEDLHPVARLRRVLQGQFDAAHRILNVNERAGLATGAMHGQRIVNRCLNQEAVQNRAIVAVIVEPVDQLPVPAGLVGMGSPDNALMQIGDAQPVILREELEQDLIQ